MRKETIQINNLPAIGAPSITHNLQYTPEKMNDCQSISPSIKNQVSTTIRLGKPTNNCLPITNSLAVLYKSQFQESSLSQILHIFWYQKRKQSLNPWILPAINKEDHSTILSHKLSAADFKPINITYQIQRLSIAFVVPGIGQFNKDRNKAEL